MFKERFFIYEVGRPGENVPPAAAPSPDFLDDGVDMFAQARGEIGAKKTAERDSLGDQITGKAEKKEFPTSIRERREVAIPLINPAVTEFYKAFEDAQTYLQANDNARLNELNANLNEMLKTTSINGGAQALIIKDGALNINEAAIDGINSYKKLNDTVAGIQRLTQKFRDMVPTAEDLAASEEIDLPGADNPFAKMERAQERRRTDRDALAELKQQTLDLRKDIPAQFRDSRYPMPTEATIANMSEAERDELAKKWKARNSQTTQIAQANNDLGSL